MLFQRVEFIDQRETSAANCWRLIRNILAVELRAFSVNVFHLSRVDRNATEWTVALVVMPML